MGNCRSLPEEFLIRVKAMPSTVPVAIRLRKMLKGMLRAYELRCVSIEPVPAPDVPMKPDTQVSGPDVA